MLDSRRPGDPPPETTSLKRERSGARKILTVPDLADLRERLRDKTIVLCHGAFDLVHMGHVLHFEEAASLGDVLVVTITADQHITKKRSVSFTEEYRARQVAALEIVDYVAIVNEPSAVAAIEALQPDVYVKGSEYSNLILDKTANIFREKDLVEGYGGRIHFTTGETFSSTKLSHFLLASPEAVQDNPLLRNERVLFRDVSTLRFTLEELKTFLVRRERAARLPARRDDRRRVGGRRGHEPVPEVAMRGRPGDGAGPPDRRDRHHRAAPVELRQAGGLFHERHARRCRPRQHHGDAAHARARSSRPASSIATADCRCSSRRSSTFPTSAAELPDFDDYDLVLIADFGHGLLDARAINERIAQEAKALRRRDGPGQLEQLRLQPAGQVRRAPTTTA